MASCRRALHAYVYDLLHDLHAAADSLLESTPCFVMIGLGITYIVYVCRIVMHIELSVRCT